MVDVHITKLCTQQPGVLYINVTEEWEVLAQHIEQNITR